MILYPEKQNSKCNVLFIQKLKIIRLQQENCILCVFKKIYINPCQIQTRYNTKYFILPVKDNHFKITQHYIFSISYSHNHHILHIYSYIFNYTQYSSLYFLYFILYSTYYCSFSNLLVATVIEILSSNPHNPSETQFFC